MRSSNEEVHRRNQLMEKLMTVYPLIASPSIYGSHKYSNNFLENLFRCAEYGYNPRDYDDPQFQKTYQILEIDYSKCMKDYQQQLKIQQQYIQQEYMRQLAQQQQQQLYQQTYAMNQQYQQQGYFPNQQQFANNQNPNYYHTQTNYSHMNSYPNNGNYQENDHRKNKSYVAKNSQPIIDNQSQSYEGYVPPPTIVQEAQIETQKEQIIQEKNIGTIIQEETKPQEQQVTQPIEPIEQEPQKPLPPKPSKFSIQQIKAFIETFSKQKANVTPIIILSVETINSWQTKTENITLKQSEPRNKNQKGGKNADKGNFNKGGNYKPSTSDNLAFGTKIKKEDTVTIRLGNNQSVQTRVLKQKFRKQAEVDFQQMMEQKVKNASEIDKAKRQIVYNLNLLAPENLKDIQGDLKSYLYDDKDICKVLIEQIIEKAWVQPKYSSTYAKLCSNFAKKDSNRFKFKHAQQVDQQQRQDKADKTEKKKVNPFKSLLIHQVQQTFIKQQQNHNFKDNAEKENYLKTKKKKILGNVKFIAQLIKIKVLNKKIAKICISELLYDFLANFNQFKKNPDQFKYSYYDYYMEAAIEFIEILSEKFQEIDDTKNNFADYAKVKQHVLLLISGQSSPQGALEQLSQLKADDYFKLFIQIDSQILSKTNNRLSSLLKNLQERRDKKWQRHHAQSQGPKKLADIQNQIAKEDQQASTLAEKKATKRQLQKLEEQMKSLLTNVQEGQTYKKQYENIVKTHDQEDIIMSFLKLVAQAKKDEVAKRLDLFDYMLEKKDVNIEILKKQWPKAISTLAFLCSDLPFCGAAMAKILIKVDEKRGIRISDFYIKFDEEEQQDEKYFMDEVFSKWFFYTQKEQIKNYVEVSSSCSGMI